MAVTRYKVLRRNTKGELSELDTFETNGPQQAMRRQMEELDAGVLADGETLIAVPVGNWTELAPKVRTQTTISFLEPDESQPEPGPVDEGEQGTVEA